jgi:undecaprenyl phosphate N,N'-diacetylbacillosamine 1-phosphate transferase
MLDRILAALGLIVLSPVFVLVWFSLLLANSGKPFFFQRRPGKGGRIFSIVKFKTMNDRRGPDGQLLPDADRLTVAGRFEKPPWMKYPS